MRCRRTSGVLALAFLLQACAPRVAVLTSKNPGAEKSTPPRSFYLRTEELQYRISFLHERERKRHLATVSTRVDLQFSQLPLWIEFTIDGEVHRLTQIEGTRQQKSTDESHLLCRGELKQSCERTTSSDVYQEWTFPLPEALAFKFATMKKGMVQLGLKDTAVFLDLSEDIEWIRPFFAQTLNDRVYR